MGYPMAKNIRRKIPQNATLIIYDVNVTVCQRFAKEFGNPATIVQAASPMQIAELSVKVHPILIWAKLIRCRKRTLF
jgi:Trk K+ transport system NAD-binding subunit